MNFLFLIIQLITFCLFFMVCLLYIGGISFLYSDQLYYFGLYIFPLLLVLCGIILTHFLVKLFMYIWTYYHYTYIFFSEDTQFIIGLIVGLIFSLLYIARISGGI